MNVSSFRAYEIMEACFLFNTSAGVRPLVSHDVECGTDVGGFYSSLDLDNNPDNTTDYVMDIPQATFYVMT